MRAAAYTKLALLLVFATVCSGRRLRKGKAEGLPSVAALERQDSGNKWSVVCSGSVISARSVLVAAHCLPTGGKAPHRVTIGCPQLSKCNRAVHEYKIEHAIEHSLHAGSKDDVALLKLSKAISFSKGPVETVEIATVDKYKGQPLSVAGWGPNGELKETGVSLLSPEECKKLSQESKISAPTICVNKADQMAGLLVQKSGNKLVQVGHSFDASVKHSIFLDLSKFSNWAEKCIDMDVGCIGKLVIVL